MKFRKLIIVIVILLSIININYSCYAKYVFEYTEKAAEIIINN